MQLFSWCYFFIQYIGIKSETNSFPLAKIPEINVGSFVSGSNAIKLEISKQFDQGLHEWGAVRFVNHSIPLQLTKNMFNGGKLFFEESLKYKLKYKFGTKQASPGYNAFGTEITENYKGTKNNIKQNLTADPVEGFYIFNNWDDINTIDIQSGNVFIPNYNHLPFQFRYNVPNAWILYRKLIQNLHWIASVALGFDIKENVFERNMTNGALMALRLSNYFVLNQTECNSNGNDTFGIRFGAHQDYSGFTMLQSDPNSVSGLQINLNNTWYTVKPQYDSLVIIGGEFIQRWTNNYWISSLHRVIYDKENMNRRRMSLIVFSSPNINVDIDVLSCNKCIQNEKIYTPTNGYVLINQMINAATSLQSRQNVNDVNQNHSAGNANVKTNLQKHD